MKKSDLVRGMVVMVISLLMGIGVFNATLSYSADRLVIKDGTATTTLTMTEDGMLSFQGGGVSSRSWEPARMDIGYGGTGGGNLEAYSKDHADAARQGKFKFIYGGGDFGGVDYVHYDGSTWVTTMWLTKDGELYMYGGAYTNGSQWIDGSSREYKENIRDLGVGEAMETLRELSPVKFNYKADSRETHVGFVAEDAPALVATNDRKGMSPMDVVAILTKVVQEQQKTISTLKEELNELKGKVR